MQAGEFVKYAREALASIYPDHEAASMVGIICKDMLGLHRYEHITSPETELDASLAEAALAAIAQLKSGKPLQYITGKAEFYGRTFNVNPSVLIPRPETELLCQKAINAARARVNDMSQLRILDLCSGSGCIAWTLALELKGSGVTGVDISADALAVAAGQNLDVACSPSFVRADIFDDGAMQKLICSNGPFNIIVSNPPYVMEKEKSQMRSNVLDYEPSIALFVPDSDPCIFYRQIAKISVLCKDTLIWGGVEINEAMGDAVSRIFSDEGFPAVELSQDLSYRNRYVTFE